MRDAQTRLRGTLQFLMTSEIPSEHKIVLIDTVIQALREHEAASSRGQLAAQASAEWQPHETERRPQDEPSAAAVHAGGGCEV